MTILKTKKGEIVVNNEEQYLYNLNLKILNLKSKKESVGLTPDEKEELEESMDLYVQLIDCLDTYGADENPKAML